MFTTWKKPIPPDDAAERAEWTQTGGGVTDIPEAMRDSVRLHVTSGYKDMLTAFDLWTYRPVMQALDIKAQEEEEPGTVWIADDDVIQHFGLQEEIADARTNAAGAVVITSARPLQGRYGVDGKHVPQLATFTQDCTVHGCRLRYTKGAQVTPVEERPDDFKTLNLKADVAFLEMSSQKETWPPYREEVRKRLNVAGGLAELVENGRLKVHIRWQEMPAHLIEQGEWPQRDLILIIPLDFQVTADMQALNMFVLGVHCGSSTRIIWEIVLQDVSSKSTSNLAPAQAARVTDRDAGTEAWYYLHWQSATFSGVPSTPDRVQSARTRREACCLCGGNGDGKGAGSAARRACCRRTHHGAAGSRVRSSRDRGERSAGVHERF